MAAQGEEPKVYSDFQMHLKWSTASIDKLITSMDENNDEFREEIDQCQDALEELADEKRTNMYPQVPGQTIQKLVEAWDARNDRTIYSEADIHEYTTELWVSLQQYEQ